MDQGIERLIHERWQFYWSGSFLMGSAFLLMGIVYAVMLVRRASNAPAAVLHS